MIKEKLETRLNSLLGSDIEIEYPAQLDHGDYSTNFALKSSKNTHKNPREYAESLANLLREDTQMQTFVDRIEVAGPGFINFWIKNTELLNQVESNQKRIQKSDKRVVIEYSSPNIAKSFSVGHFRSTIIGQAIYNLFDYIGYDTLGVNHIGDWGTQFGMILAEIEETGVNVEDLSIAEIEALYTQFNKKLDSQPELREKAKMWFKKLEDGDSQAVERWKSVWELSIHEFNKTYDKLGVHIDELRGESFYEDKMSEIIDSAKENNIASAGEGGALIVEFDSLPPAMLVKSDGTTTYFTRDLAALKYRVEHDNAKLIVYEVGAEQILHFRQLFEAARQFEWGKEVELVHVPHGLVRLKSGKMSTRKGNTIKLKELLEKAIEKSNDPLIGIGALKYNDLKRNPASEIVFDWDEVLSMEGNSGPYLQYSVVRAKSVIEKSLKNSNQPAIDIKEIGEVEKKLLRKLSRFDEVIVAAANNYSPSDVTTYLFDLAQDFNAFYSSEKIIGSDIEESRVALCKHIAQKIEKGLELLGIQVPEKM